MRNKINIISRCCCVLLLGFTGICLYLRAEDHTFILDEVSYFYSFEEPDASQLNNPEYFNGRKPIETFWDVCRSMVRHHIIGNGRTPIHFAIQLLCAWFNPTVFYIFNTAVFILFVVLLMRLCVPAEKRHNALLWLTALCIILNCFPEQWWLWTSINIAPNYLWPIVLVTGVYIYFSNLHDPNYAFKHKWIVWIVSFFAGWSHEGVGIPLAGAFVVYMLIHRRNLDKRLWQIAIPLWLGTLLVISSPNLYKRFSGQVGTMHNRWYIFDVINIIDHQWSLMLFCIATFVLFFISRVFILDFLKNNLIYVITAILSVGFISLAHSDPRSLILGELAGFILLLKLIAVPDFWNSFSRKQLIFSLGLLILFIWQQIAVVKATRLHEQQVRQALVQVKESPNGQFDIPTDTNPWYIQHLMWDKGFYYEHILKSAAKQK